MLIDYGLTNLAALRLPQKSRRYLRWISAAGLGNCAGLAFFVDPKVILAGLSFLALGLLVLLVMLRQPSA